MSDESIVVRMSTVKNSREMMLYEYATVARTMPGPPRAFIVTAKFSFDARFRSVNWTISSVPIASSVNAMAKNARNRSQEKSLSRFSWMPTSAK